MKSKIIKNANDRATRVAAFGRDLREEFPEAPIAEPTFADVEEPVEVEEAAPDPEEIRAAVLAEARAEAEMKLKEAYQEGLARGEEAGRAAFDARVALAAEALQQAAAAVEAARADFLDALEPQVVELAVLVAERVLQRECRMDVALVHATVRRALAKLSDRQRLRIRLHPADLPGVQDTQLQLLEAFPGVETLELHADENIAPGGCLIDSDTMQVDARIETLLGDVIDTLLDRQDEPR